MRFMMSRNPKPGIGQRRGERSGVSQAAQRALVEEMTFQMENHPSQPNDNGRPADQIPKILPNRRPAIAHGQSKHQDQRRSGGEEQRNVFGLIAKLIDRMGEIDVEGEKSNIQRSRTASTQICGRAHQRSLSLAMLSPELGGHGLEFDRLLQHGIVAVPLHEVRAAHERAVFAGPSVVMPEIEVNEVDRLSKTAAQSGRHPCAIRSRCLARCERVRW